MKRDLHPSSLAASLLAALLVTATSGAALADDDDEGKRPKTSQAMEVVGFSTDGSSFVLKVEDEMRGPMYQIRDAKRGTVAEAFPFREDTEKKAWRQVKKAIDLDKEWVNGPENPKKEVVMMTAPKGTNLCIYMMQGEAIKLYTKVALLTTDKGEVAESFVKQMAWDRRGKYAVLVYHQKIKDLLEWEGDFVHAFKFRAYKASFDDDEEDGGDAP